MDINESQAEALFNEYKHYVYRTALLLTKSRSLADDITQETFIRIMTKFHTYDSGRPIKPWIYTITINVTRTLMKKQKWIDRFSLFTDSIREDHVNSLEDLFLKHEEAKEIWECVKQLSLKSREVVVLHFYLGFTLKECAKIIGIPEGTAKSRLHTALKQLRRNKSNLRREGGDYVG